MKFNDIISQHEDAILGLYHGRKELEEELEGLKDLKDDTVKRIHALLDEIELIDSQIRLMENEEI